MRTVERRRCSAISPNPGMAMLVGSMYALANDDGCFPEGATANKFERERCSNGFSAKLPVNVFEPGDCMAGQGHKNVTDNHAGLVRWAFGLDFEDDGGGFVVALQRFSQRIRQTHRLQANAKIAVRNAAFLQER